MAKAKVSAKGWIVIPASLRRKYNIEPGVEVAIVDYGGVLSLVPLVERPAEQARGALRGKKSLTKALSEDRKRERKRDKRR